MRRPSAWALAVLACAVCCSAAADPIRLSYLYSDGNIPGTVQALATLIKERPELREKIKLTVLTESVYDQVPADDLLKSDVLVLDTMNEQMLQKFDAEHHTSLIATIVRHGTVLGVGEGLLGESTYTRQGVVWNPRARAYWTHSGATNQLGLMKLALAYAGVKGLTLPEPQLSLDFGYYYPDGEGGRVFASWNEFDAWRAAHEKKKPHVPRIAISFFKATYYSGDTALLDALIAQIERSGAEAIPLFGYPGAVAVQHLLLDESGAPRADVVLGENFNFSDFEASKLLAKVDVPVINLVTLYGRSEKDWRESKTGLSMFEGTFNLAVPELAGTTAPTVVGSKEKVRDEVSGVTSVVTRPIGGQVPIAVARAIRYAKLRTTPNGEKHVAVLYYNYPPGKANVGASYLNVADSIANVLARFSQDGYDIGPRMPSSDEVLNLIVIQARNVSAAAPGELQEMLAAGHAVRVSMEGYRRWLGSFPQSLREKILKDWGQPEKSLLMTEHDGNRTSFVIPVVQYGKVILMPQPARAWGEDLEKLYHAKDLAPHHQYAAAYLWLRNVYHADAVVHLGTHGTLEWLDGKDAGLSPEDAPDALIADLPDLYIYNVDVVGEGLVARRRGMATLVDHMVPPFKKGGLTPALAALSESLNDYASNETKNPELAAQFAKDIERQATKLGIAKDMGHVAGKPWGEEELHKLEGYLLDLKGQNIPYGLHAFGRTPEKALRASTVDAIVSTDRSLLPDRRKVLAEDIERRIAISGPRELENLSRALAGRFVSAGSGGEPIRNPDAYPTGNNFYGIDPDKVPKRASWEIGSKLAEQMLQDHLRKNGKYPQKVSFVIWGDETMRHEGVLESQIFYLLGTRPVWNERGKVVGVDVIPRQQLGRPRVDIVIASAAEGMFNSVTRLMDEAVQKVKAMDEADNFVRQHYLATKAALIAKGYAPDDADRRAGVRIFDEPPGTFNLNTSSIVAASGSWESDAGFANDYIRKLGHGYGNGFWGEPMQDVFRMALSGTDAVVHSSSTALYGALDNDDMFMYVGGLAAAVRSVDGKTPDVLVTNTRDPGKPEMTTLDQFIGKEFRSRYVNPTWIAGMKKEGYAGAGEMRAFVEYLWGWDATVTSAVDDAMWKETFDTYVADQYRLDLKQFFESKSPYAYQDMTARMLETIRKEYWHADAATKNTLLREYLDSVVRHGVNCTENSCGNARLLEYVLKEARVAGIRETVLQNAQAKFEKAMGKGVVDAARSLENFATRNEARERAEARQGRQTARPASATQVKGQLMEQENRTPRDVRPRVESNDESPWSILWLGIPLLVLLFGWRQHHRVRAS